MTAPAAAVLLANATVVDGDRVERRDLAFDGGRVVAAAATGTRRVDLGGHYIYPGLINAHDHLQLNCFRRLEHAEPFADSYEWIAAFEARMGDDPQITSTRAIAAEERFSHGAYKNLFSGVTTVAHHDPVPASVDASLLPLTLAPAGWAHSLGLGSADRDGRTKYGPLVHESFREAARSIPWIIHLAEGTSPRAGEELEQLRALGCLAANTVLVHGVGLSAADVEHIIGAGASVVWCPSSNLELFGRTLDPRTLIAAGRLALGTDSRLTGSADLLDELRVAQSCSSLTPRELVQLVTCDAARVLRLDDAGTLGIGARADCLVLREDGDPWETLLRASRGDLRAVVRSGRFTCGDSDLASAFGLDDGAFRELRIDGMPKVIDSRVYREAALALEPGVELVTCGVAA